VAILFSQTLSTGLGDWMADTNGLGYEGGAIVFAGALAVVAAAYYLHRDFAHPLVLGSVRPNATARRNPRRPARQAG
jgi:CRISPR/Cas system-associated protein Csm6